jgi:hypothetical protein
MVCMSADDPPLALQSLPLFPLGTVLFPGGSLPLQIFEVRYLDMIGKCHKLGAPFGVVGLTQGHEVQRAGDGSARPAEAFHAVGTLASIAEFSTPQPGLMLVRCVGQQRFRITRSDKLKHGLWVADVTHLPADTAVPVPDDLKPVAQALERLINTLHERQVPLEQMPLRSPYQLDDCGWVANRWCELLTLPLAQKQQLMELDNPLLRLELVSDLLTQSGIAV